ncbi:hypothetical protein GCM10023335_05730 [Streptomyces siamensis]|uniref:Uncharacterized protein n=1 Tax=Streptomyces siamensis TaxID=1274986 RepID=A0ABP9IFG4_9ACTN
MPVSDVRGGVPGADVREDVPGGEVRGDAPGAVGRGPPVPGGAGRVRPVPGGGGGGLPLGVLRGAPGARGGVPPGPRVSWRPGGRVPGWRFVLVITLFMRRPRSLGPGRYRAVTCVLGILYGAGEGHRNEAVRVSRRPGRFTYQGCPVDVGPVGTGECRVNPGPGVDVVEGASGDSKGDARTYPEGPSGRRSPPLRRTALLAVRRRKWQPCASTSP